MRNTLETELGPVSLVFDEEGRLLRLLMGRIQESRFVNEEVVELVRRYLEGGRVDFTGVPVSLEVSLFVEKVLEVVRGIPYGKVVSYRYIGDLIGCKGYRAVGVALRMNPVPIVIPCHRVIRSDGGLGGFSAGLEWKRFLLSLEGVLVDEKD